MRKLKLDYTGTMQFLNKKRTLVIRADSEYIIETALIASGEIIFITRVSNRGKAICKYDNIELDTNAINDFADKERLQNILDIINFTDKLFTE
jgi:hypothetical protein